jgi:lysozyme family protein
MNFEAALKFVLGEEGGFSNNPNDGGGVTMAGVTQKAYDSFRRRHGYTAKAVTKSTAAERKQLYFEDYWKPAGCELLHIPLDILHFDSAVNHGPATAIKLLQRAANVTDDGIFGHRTAAAVGAAPCLFDRYLIERYQFYGEIINNDRSQLTFICGWMNRMQKCYQLKEAA